MTHDCDETCQCCAICYRASGYSTCQQTCEHAACVDCHEPTEPGTDQCPACEQDVREPV